MDYQLALDYLYNLGHETLAMKLGLENISSLLKEMQQPHQAYSIIHVAGTNGKGSFCATLASILAQTLIPTGLFISPHLIDITERFQYNLQPITQETFAKLTEYVKITIDNALENHKLAARPTFFEHVTAIGLEYFRKCNARLAILEVGLGGRLDSTNVVSPILSVITSIDFDHQEYLGNTLAAIAREKAGILKPGVPAIIAPQQQEAAEVISKVASQVGAPLIWLDTKKISVTGNKEGFWEFDFQASKHYQKLLPGLRGYHQVATSALSILAVEELNKLGFNISLENITEGLKKTCWPGRLELIKNNPDLLFDGAHNPHGIKSLVEFLIHYTKEKEYKKKVLVFSTMRDKDFLSMAKDLFPLFDSVILVQRSDPRAMNFHEANNELLMLAKECAIAQNTETALELAYSQAKVQGLVVVSGSLHLIGEAKRYLKNKQQPYQEKNYGI